MNNPTSSLPEPPQILARAAAGDIDAIRELARLLELPIRPRQDGHRHDRTPPSGS